jgi:hypothetical protein
MVNSSRLEILYSGKLQSIGISTPGIKPKLKDRGRPSGTISP